MPYAISRRSFLKSAAVLTAAVAAAGVLAGCGSTGKEVEVSFYSSKFSKIVGTAKIKVGASAKELTLDQVQNALPEGWVLTAEDAAKQAFQIVSDSAGHYAQAQVEISADYRTLQVTYYANGEVGKEVLLVKKSDTVLTAAQLTLPTGYKLAESVDYTIVQMGSTGFATINVVAIA